MERSLGFFILQKLDNNSLQEWETHRGFNREYPTYREIDEFLANRIRILKAINASNAATSAVNKIRNSKSVVKSHATSSSSKCLLCKKNHNLADCYKFKAQSVEKRKETAVRHHCCFNCLMLGHRPYKCSSELRCTQCSRKHHTLLHMNVFTVPANINKLATDEFLPAVSNDSASAEKTRSASSNTGTGARHVVRGDVAAHLSNQQRAITSRSTLLATACISVQADNGRIHKFRVLLDQGSECCFVSERVIKMLKPRCEKINAHIYGVDGTSIRSARKLAQFNLIPIERNCSPVRIEALVLVYLTSYSPPIKPNGIEISQLAQWKLADSEPFSAKPTDFILGADIIGSCLLDGLEQSAFGILTAQWTMFGWILSGSIEERDEEQGSHLNALSSITSHSCITAKTAGRVEIILGDRGTSSEESSNGGRDSMRGALSFDAST